MVFLHSSLSPSVGNDTHWSHQHPAHEGRTQHKTGWMKSRKDTTYPLCDMEWEIKHTFAEWMKRWKVISVLVVLWIRQIHLTPQVSIVICAEHHFVQLQSIWYEEKKTRPLNPTLFLRENKARMCEWTCMQGWMCAHRVQCKHTHCVQHTHTQVSSQTKPGA